MIAHITHSVSIAPLLPPQTSPSLYIYIEDLLLLCFHYIAGRELRERENPRIERPDQIRSEKEDMLRLITGIPGPSGFGSSSTAEQVSQGIDASNLTAIITGTFPFMHSDLSLSHSRNISKTTLIYSDNIHTCKFVMHSLSLSVALLVCLVNYAIFLY